MPGGCVEGVGGEDYGAVAAAAGSWEGGEGGGESGGG